MAFTHVDLALGSGLNDGTDWTNAYQGSAGLVTAAAAAASGDTIYVKNSESNASSITITGNETIAETANPILIITVLSATTNTGGSIVQGDLIPGLRTGASVRAYDYVSETAPTITKTGTADIFIRGSFFIYGMIFNSADDITITGANNGPIRTTYEECEFIVTGSGDNMNFAFPENANHQSTTIARHCRFDATAGNLTLGGSGRVYAFDCEFDSTKSTGNFTGVEWTGAAELHACDLSGMHATLNNVADYHNSKFEYFNCTMPASHVLTTGTATHNYTVTNWGSEDSTGLTSGSSEQAFEQVTYFGTVDVETTATHTGGASDGATGTWGWAMVPNNVTDNVVGVTSPWMYKWVDGDGTAQTLTVFIANSAAEAAANLIEDDEIFLEVLYPSEAGISRFDYRPNDEAAATNFGYMPLLGTAADITTTSETWGTGANNDQSLIATIDPDYQGWVYCRVHYSKASGPTLYVDPEPTIT